MSSDTATCWHSKFVSFSWWSNRHTCAGTHTNNYYYFMIVKILVLGRRWRTDESSVCQCRSRKPRHPIDFIQHVYIDWRCKRVVDGTGFTDLCCRHNTTSNTNSSCPSNNITTTHAIGASHQRLDTIGRSSCCSTLFQFAFWWRGTNARRRPFKTFFQHEKNTSHQQQQ